MARLKHEGIVGIHGLYEFDDLLLLSLEYLSGGSLADRLRSRQPLATAEIRRILQHVGEAMQYAHDKGIVHRDLKPANILFRADDDRAVVSDFGLAKRIDGTLRSRTRTQIGTPAYMSPEQWKAEPATAASDQYALGIVVWHMLVGHPPFEGTEYQVSSAHLESAAPSLRPHRPDCPPALEKTVHRMLAKSPGDRFPTIREAVRNLQSGLEQLESAPAEPQAAGLPPTRSAGTMPLWRVAALVLVLGGIGGVAWYGRGQVRATGGGDQVGDSSRKKNQKLAESGKKQIVDSVGADTLAIRGIPGRPSVGNEYRIVLHSTKVGGPVPLPAGARWVVNEPAVARIDSLEGRLTIIGHGQTQVVAWLGDSVLAARRIIVAPPSALVANIDITVDAEFFVGDTVAASVELFDEDGRPLSGVPVTLRVLPSHVARLDGSRRIVGLSAGTATLYAVTSNGQEWSRSIRVMERERPSSAPRSVEPPSDLAEDRVREEWENIKRIIVARNEGQIRARYLTTDARDRAALSALAAAIRGARSVSLSACISQGGTTTRTTAAFTTYCQLRRDFETGTPATIAVQMQIVLDRTSSGWATRGFRVTNAPAY
ncbi:MAG: serine/threonine protein kinase [Gemmatimonadetes bacterium]|nr:serine/threonine protein kinase [Gemmatimonadota bacterium]